jgi:hypothetical protein
MRGVVSKHGALLLLVVVVAVVVIVVEKRKCQAVILSLILL